jgi:hypothetical protein
MNDHSHSGDNDDAGTGDAQAPYHRSGARTRPPVADQAAPPPTPQRAAPPDGDGVDRLSDASALNAEGWDFLLGFLRDVRDGEEPLGPLQLFSPAENTPTPPIGKGKGKKAPSSPPSAPSSVDQRTGGQAWPSGPLVGTDLFTPDEVRQLVEGILTDDEIMSHTSMPGLTRARLRAVAKRIGLEANRFGRHSAALIIWFADAGVTVLADDKSRTDWSRPRPLIGNDRAEIRRRLWATDPPDGKTAGSIARSAGFDRSSL